MARVNLSSKRRRALKTWILASFGDGKTCSCVGCGKTLDYETLTMDRHPIRGWDGGQYVQGNLRPMCRKCNAADGREEQRRRMELLRKIGPENVTVTKLDCYHTSAKPCHVILPFGEGADVCPDCYQHFNTNVVLAINRAHMREWVNNLANIRE